MTEEQRGDSYRLEFDRSIGRSAFGADPDAYDSARPDYPPRIYDILAECCGLKAGAAVFEVGPGPGKATRHLLERGAHPLVCIEPDPRLASHLRRSFGDRIEVQNATFEAASLTDAAFDLGVAATSFHWVDPDLGPPKVLRALKPGGHWAMWWNHYGDPDNPDGLYQLLQPLYAELPKRVYRSNRRASLKEQIEQRAARFAEAGFVEISSETMRWPVKLTSREMRDLYASFSELSSLDEAPRARFLEQLGRIVDEHYGGRIEREWVTSIEWARRPG